MLVLCTFIGDIFHDNIVKKPIIYKIMEGPVILKCEVRLVHDEEKYSNSIRDFNTAAYLHKQFED